MTQKPTTATLTLLDIEQLATTLMNQIWVIDDVPHNLISLGWTFKFNNTKKSLGSCYRQSKTVCLSQYLFQHNFTEDIWEDVIKHEIAHAIDFERRDVSDHGPEWIHIAEQVGCIVERGYSGQLRVSDTKYILKCNHCGDTTPSHRKRKRAVACRTCCTEHNNGKFSDKFALELIINH